MYWLCMIATISLATGNNCISARGMLAIVWHCVLLFFLCVFFVDFLHVNKSSSQKNISTLSVYIYFQPFLGSGEASNRIVGKLKLGNETLATLDGHWDQEVFIKDKATGVSCSHHRGRLELMRI